MSFKVAVNYRLTKQDSDLTGIPKFTKILYEYLSSQHKDIEINYFIPKRKSILNNIIFDTLQITFLASLNKTQILHGPANTLPIIKPKSIKYVLTVHDISFKVISQLYNHKFLIYYNFIFKRSLRLADLIICDSKSTMKDLIKFYPKVKNKTMQVIYPGLDSDFICNKKVKQTSQNKKKFFLSISTHPKRKNIDIILEIIASNKKLFKDHTYVIVGKINNDNYNQLLIKIAKLKLNKFIEIRGFVSKKELTYLYRQAEFLLYPSLYEGFGFPVIEAAASKCLVITSNNSSLSEILPCDINKKLYVNPLKRSSILDAIKFAIHLNKKAKQNIIETNYKYVTEAFSWDTTAKQYYHAFKELN